MKIDNNKCLVIGGNGFIGINLIIKLLDLGMKVRVLSRNNNNIPLEIIDKIEFIRGNLTDREIIRSSIKNIDYIFYFVSCTNVSSSINDVYKDNNNVLYMINLLEGLKENKIKKLIFASSGGTVYGEPRYVPVDENHPRKPISPYGITKASIENYLNFYKRKYNINYCVCRYSNPYGKYQYPSKGTGAINIFLYKHLNGEEITIYGDKTKIIRDYIYIDDLIEATVRIAFKEKTNYDIYNVGSGIGLSLQDLINSIEKATKKKIRIKEKNSKDENVEKIILNIDRLKKEFDWNPKVDLDLGVNLSKLWITELIKKR
ncbi:NAD-dependent epimerase/dehydratase family protein [Tepidibacter formicigenes]|jgi:UDP-glucose 4-epimerase|uniref:UDP-glucose 4-epimerase n=1 Tax=Tepidibacter formicigenes DSM 15518 TaxID=1123349 RepID=A0A1M6QVC4_9FIRM|nr:NAD-dependent epimerase/dehydratase family protein [Tepidibacter formicigenes]SHK24174.1 UDP-glucose 4-epimerase [Tepidibacter formicigenes DSM 15518]